MLGYFVDSWSSLVIGVVGDASKRGKKRRKEASSGWKRATGGQRSVFDFGGPRETSMAIPQRVSGEARL